MKLLNAAAAILLAVMAAPDAQAADKIVLGANAAMANTVLYVAQEDKIFEKNGLDVEIVHVAGSSKLLPAAVSGSMQIIVPSVPNLLQAIDGGLDLKILSGLNATSAVQLDFGVVVGNDTGITDAKGFAGKTLGVSNFNGFTDLLFKKWLEANDVDPNGVTFVEVPFPQMGDVLKQGTVDGVVTLQPFLARMLANKIGKLGPNFLQGLPDRLPVVAMTATADWAAANPDIINRFVLSLEEANAAVLKDKERAKGIAIKHLKLPDDVRDQVPVPVYEIEVTPERLGYWIDTMKSLDLLRTEISSSALILKR